MVLDKLPLPKICFFDMEGTLLKKNHALDNGKVAPSAWTTLAQMLGEDCLRDEEETKNKWLNGGYKGYLDWMKDTVLIHKKYGLNKKLIDELVEAAELHPGAHELVRFLQKKGTITVIVSGGIKALADKVQCELMIDHSFSGCEYFFNSEGDLVFYNLLPSDNQGKVQFMQQIALEHGISPRDCLFIGDGKNDVYLAKEVGFSIAFNAQIELNEVATISINQGKDKEDLSAIIEIFSK